MNDELTTEDEIEAFAKKLETTKETIICIIKIIKSKRKNSDYGFSR